MLLRQQNNALKVVVLKPLLVVAWASSGPRLLCLSACVRNASAWTWPNSSVPGSCPSSPGQKALALLHLPPAGDGACLAGSPAASPPVWVPGEGTVGVLTVGCGRTFEANALLILPRSPRSGLRRRAAGERTGWASSRVEVTWECTAGALLC